MKRRNFVHQSAQATLAMALPSHYSFAAAQNATFQSKGFRIVVPFPAGGATDATARLIGERLTKVFNQSVVVDNKTGASGAIGCAEVAKSAADGHTLLYTISDPLIANTVLIKDPGYNPQKDFRFVASILRSPALLSVPSTLGVNNFEDFKRYLAANKGQFSYASWGIGSLGHIAGEGLSRRLQASGVHIAQRGEAGVMQDLLSSSVNSGFSSAGTARQHVQSGKIVPLAMMGFRRSSALPSVPTFRELGYDEPLFDMSVWMGFLVPSKTPDDVVNRLSSEIIKVAESAEVSKVISDRALEPMVEKPEIIRLKYIAEFSLITKHLRQLNIQPS